MWYIRFSVVRFFMPSGRNTHYLRGPTELWVRQNRTGPLLLQSPAGQGLMPLDSSNQFFPQSSAGPDGHPMKKNGDHANEFILILD